MNELENIKTSIGLTSESHGAGTTTTALLLAKLLGLQYQSTSILVRKYAKMYFGNQTDSPEDQLRLATPAMNANKTFEARVDRRAIRAALSKPSIFEGKNAVKLARSGLIPNRTGQLEQIQEKQKVFSIKLTCSKEESALRALTREHAIKHKIDLGSLSAEEVEKIRESFSPHQVAEMSNRLYKRMRGNKKRWKNQYEKIKPTYDLTIDTSKINPEQVAQRIVLELIKKKIITPQNFKDYLSLLTNIIPKFNEDKRLTSEIRQLRKSAPAAIGWLLNHHLVENLDLLDIRILGENESVRSACYTLVFDKHGKTEDLVCKLTTTKPSLDLLAMSYWQKSGVATSQILDFGEINSPLLNSKVYFLLMNKILKKNMEPALDGYPLIDDFYAKKRKKVTLFGHKAGQILSRMTSVPTDELFQGPGFEESTSFPEMIVKFVKQHKKELKTIGIPNKKIGLFIKKLTSKLMHVKAFFVHNDFAPHNLLATDDQEIDLVVIDPNTIVADKYWDLAAARNRLQWLQLQLESNPNDKIYQYKLEREKLYYRGLRSGFTENSKNKIDPQCFLLVRIAQAIWKVCKTQSENPSVLDQKLQKIHQFRIASLKKLLEEL